MAARLFLKLLAALLFLFGAAVVAVDLLASRVAESSYVATLAERLELEGTMLARAAQRDPDLLEQEGIRRLAAPLRARLTVIAPDGRVLADSEAAPARMENHRERPEVIPALAGHAGRAIRPSPTMGVSFLYVAIPLSGGALRLAVPLAEVHERARTIRSRMLASVALAFLPSVLLAAWLARRIAGRLGRIIELSADLARGNFQARLEESGSREFRALIRQLNQTGEKLQRLVEEIQREQAELEKLEQVRRDFVVNVSHELRTPVASIQGYAETLLEGALEDPRHNLRFLTVIRQNAERLARLTEDLLTLSRLERRSREFQFAAYRLEPLLAEALDTMRPIAAKRNVKIELEPMPEGLEVFCDAQAVHQILSNLLDNAVKYSPAEGLVRVGARLAPSGDAVEICVRDQGPGIPPEDLPRVFERFYRVDKARSREAGGTGLGLAIVKHLVLAQGGATRVESEPGKGAAFYFTLPREEPDAATDPGPRAAAMM